MKKLAFLIPIIVIAFFSCEVPEKKVTTEQEYQSADFDSIDATNNFYDNAQTFNLNTPSLLIEGEVNNPGEVDLSKLPLHSVIVKETKLTGEGNNRFTGAYRYDGYSLFDILNYYKIQKNHPDSFNPVIDLLVEVENNKGEKVIFSWGEIFYPNHLNEIIIATKVMRIVPSKTNELWPLPDSCKIVSAADLFTHRNISNPVKITVKSAPVRIEQHKGMNPMTSDTITFYRNNEIIKQLSMIPKEISMTTLHTIFYGRGRGIHSTQPFTGVKLADILKDYIPLNEKAIKQDYIVIGAPDGYRCVYTLSEIANRNDQADILLVPVEEDNGGHFKIFPSCDFFSDRAVKAINKIYFMENK